ncbi:MAG: AarF/ABC1/UbiB kinase family protein [Myxococcales bacterium]|nr:AarF/ABC1/UbiB kinase family protein [Myxococcales bacterium]
MSDDRERPLGGDSTTEPPEAGSSPLERLAEGFRKRTWVTTKSLGRLGVQLAKQNLGINELFSKASDAGAVAMAEKLLCELDEMKGLMLKVGQMVSYLDSTLPPAAQELLRRLQAESKPMSYAVIAEVIRHELGADPPRVFESFDERPFAAASIGQVHRARVEGRDVAVKVQYPGIAKLLEADVRTISRLSRFALFFSQIDGPDVLAELNARLQEECDYSLEALHQRYFAHALAETPGVRVPAVLGGYSTARVLTSELCEGLGFYDFIASASSEVKNRAATTIYRSCFQSIFHHCTYNADPHPGNYIFGADGLVTLLDFGCVKRFSATFIDVWKRLARSICDDDVPGFREAFIDAGFVGTKRGFDFEHQLAAMRVLYRRMIGPDPFHFTHDFVNEANEALTLKNRNKFKMAMPGDWLFVNRLQFGLFSLLALMGATLDVRRMFREAIDSQSDPLYEKPLPDEPRSAAEAETRDARR